MGSAANETIPNPIKNFRIQTASFTASAAAIYSASVVELATVSYLEDFQLTAPLFKQNMYPDCDLQSSLSVWKLSSTNPVTSSSHFP